MRSSEFGPWFSRLSRHQPENGAGLFL